MGFTKNQLKAINTRNKNILVSAAAGSGKTTVLAERIINKILNDKVNVDNLLVVTFTHAAANEMKERILKRINNELLINPQNNFLKEQLTRINKAQISTIDAFCLKVVKTHFKTIDIDPNFRIGDSAELSILRLEALETFLDTYYEENDANFLNIVDSFTKKSDDKAFIEVFFKVYNEAQNTTNPHLRLENSYKQFNIFTKEDYFNSPIFSKILEYTKEYLTELLTLFDNIKLSSTGVLNFEDFSTTEGSLENFLTVEFQNYHNLMNYINNKNYDAFMATLEDMKYARWSVKFLKEEPELKEEIKNLRDISKDLFKSLKDKFFNKSIDTIIDNNKNIYPIIKDFCNLIIDFDNYFMEIKKTKKIFTFNDISHFCLNILVENNLPTSVAKEYRNIFEEVIIDEYQDSNSIQEAILSSISENNRFMVGDIKQCIYKFRQANPKIFNEKYNGYFNKTLDGERIDLNANFRSNTHVVDSINMVFENIMSNELGEVCYDDNAKLYNKANFKTPSTTENTLEKCEFCIIDCSKNEDLDNELSNIQNVEIEAHFICQKILSMINENKLVFEKDTYRPLEYKDIVVLIRSSVHFDVFSKIFEEYNLPVYCKSSNGFYDFIEIKTILNILKILDNPLQDLPLISVMYSPIFNFSSNELLEIKLFSKNNLFFYNILDFIKNSENIALKNKCILFAEKIEHWQIMSRSFSLNELLSYIYEDSNYYNYLGLLENGNIRQSNLFSLLEKALSFQSTNLYSIFAFVSYIEKIKTFAQDGEANILSEDENLIKIMTIHKSKGLEFPIVFLANLDKNFNEMDSKKPILFDEEYMLGISIFKNIFDDEFSSRKTIDSIQKSVIKNKIKEENYSEEMRILYVALTRAKEKLILTGTISKDFTIKLKSMESLILSSSLGSFKNFLPKYFINKGISNNYLAWVYTSIKNYDDKNIWDLYYKNIPDILENIPHNNLDEKVNLSKNTIFNQLLDIDTNINYGDNFENIQESLNWKYSNSILQNLSSTLSVSEIKRIYQTKFLNTDNTIKPFIKTLEMPSFYTNAKDALSAAQIGSTYHKVFENIDFSISNENELDLLLKNLLNKNLLTEKEILSLNKSKILSFFKSDLALRIRNSNYIKREAIFTIGLKPSQIYTDKIFENIDDIILVNGIIDLYFEENDYLVLLDYKSDNIKADNIFVDKYKSQLEIYKKALENATGKKVKECLIYSILNEKTIHIPI